MGREVGRKVGRKEGRRGEERDKSKLEPTLPSSSKARVVGGSFSSEGSMNS